MSKLGGSHPEPAHPLLTKSACARHSKIIKDEGELCPTAFAAMDAACAKACESPKTPSKASDASEWSAPMACVGGTASAARLKRPKSSAQRGDGLRGRRHPQLGRAGEFAAQTNFPDAWGRMLVARPDFGRCPQHWRPPGASHRSCSAAMEARLGWLRVCNVRTHALTKGLRPFFKPKTGSVIKGR